MQQLYIGDKTEPIEVVRSFKRNPESALLCEFSDGTFGYTNGQRVKGLEEVDFLPDVHRIRAEAYVNSKKPRVSNPKPEVVGMTTPSTTLPVIEHDARYQELFDMNEDQLYMVAGADMSVECTKDQLISMVLEKEKK